MKLFDLKLNNGFILDESVVIPRQDNYTVIEEFNTKYKSILDRVINFQEADTTSQAETLRMLSDLNDELYQANLFYMKQAEYLNKDEKDTKQFYKDLTMNYLTMSDYIKINPVTNARYLDPLSLDGWSSADLVDNLLPLIKQYVESGETVPLMDLKMVASVCGSDIIKNIILNGDIMSLVYKSLSVASIDSLKISYRSDLDDVKYDIRPRLEKSSNQEVCYSRGADANDIAQTIYTMIMGLLKREGNSMDERNIDTTSIVHTLVNSIIFSIIAVKKEVGKAYINSYNNEFLYKWLSDAQEKGWKA